MSSSRSPHPGGRTGASTSTGASSADLPRLMSRSSARFGTLSHHSFFSRHNPHPSRVRHIQGLNGRPVCTVRDEWFVTSSLFPHPLLKGSVRRGPDLPLAQRLFGASASKSKSSLLSERWRDELKELAAQINMSPVQPNHQKEEGEEPVRRHTQYSSQTGRIIPSSTGSSQRRSRSHWRPRSRPPPPHPHVLLHDQELMVLELLCQILQTDSFSSVQHWLLLAGPREKEQVTGMIKRALDGTDLQNQDLRLYPHLPPQCRPNADPTWRPRPSDSRKQTSSSGQDRPERLGDAEVLQIVDADENMDQTTDE
ncbi:protein TBATA [Eucyclogobius newberryi]|uniref:protein TBATA n=1 Tax=Eucyclogobius newberryi TaxID=166745 RepID=UPI003B5C18F4